MRSWENAKILRKCLKCSSLASVTFFYSRSPNFFLWTSDFPRKNHFNCMPLPYLTSIVLNLINQVQTSFKGVITWPLSCAAAHELDSFTWTYVVFFMWLFYASFPSIFVSGLRLRSPFPRKATTSVSGYAFTNKPICYSPDVVLCFIWATLQPVIKFFVHFLVISEIKLDEVRLYWSRVPAILETNSFNGTPVEYRSWLVFSGLHRP